MCVDTKLPAVSDWSSFPWNRRLRRSIERATHTPGSVLVNCSGDGKVWVLSVGGRDVSLRSREVFQQMLRWALTGVFGGFVYELPSLANPGDERTTEEIMGYLRWMLLFGASQAFKDSQASSSKEGVSSEDLEPGESDDALPDDLADSEQVALWALRRAAARFQGVRKNWVTEGCQENFGEALYLVCEVPVASGSGDQPPWGKWTKTLVGWQEEYEFHRACFDQGCLGAPEACKTELVTSSWFLFEALQGHRVFSEWAKYSELLKLLSFGSERESGWTVPLTRVIQNAWESGTPG